MRFETAREVLNHANSFHLQLSEFYKTLAKGQDQNKAKLLLDYFVEHEQELADTLRRYEKDADDSILETWFEYTHDEEVLIIPGV